MKLTDFKIYRNENYYDSTPRNIAVDIDNVDNNIFLVNRVSFQLSNLCNYTDIHKACPLSLCRGKEILPSTVVHKTIDELAEFDYSGLIGFHIYNEPMIDPRLFLFISYAKKRLP